MSSSWSRDLTTRLEDHTRRSLWNQDGDFPRTKESPTVGGLETETLCKKECKNKKKTDIFSIVDDGWGHGYYLVKALCLTKRSFSFLSMLIFWARFLQNASLKKLPNFKISPNKKYLCWDNETWSEPVPDTYKRTEKIAGCSHFQGHCT